MLELTSPRKGTETLICQHVYAEEWTTQLELTSPRKGTETILDTITYEPR
jgi:hypothetical protein